MLRDPGLYWAPATCESPFLVLSGADALQELVLGKGAVLALTFITGRRSGMGEKGTFKIRKIINCFETQFCENWDWRRLNGERESCFGFVFLSILL